jgi:ribosomal protein L19
MKRCLTSNHQLGLEVLILSNGAYKVALEKEKRVHSILIYSRKVVPYGRIERSKSIYLTQTKGKGAKVLASMSMRTLISYTSQLLDHPK